MSAFFNPMKKFLMIVGLMAGWAGLACADGFVNGAGPAGAAVTNGSTVPNNITIGQSGLGACLQLNTNQGGAYQISNPQGEAIVGTPGRLLMASSNLVLRVTGPLGIFSVTNTGAGGAFTFQNGVLAAPLFAGNGAGLTSIPPPAVTNAPGFWNASPGISGTANANDTYIGWNAGTAGGSASGNVALGAYATETLAGNNNTAVGFRSMLYSYGSSYNTALGYYALYGTGSTASYYNVGLGCLVMQQLQTGSYNAAAGGSALYHLQTGSYNTALGYGALFGDYAGGTNIAIGPYAGYNEAGSLQFYVGNGAQNNSLASDRTNSLMWGTLSGAANSSAGQQLTINAALTARNYSGNGSGLTNLASVYRAGTVTVAASATTTTVTFATPLPAWVGANYAISFGSASGFDTFPSPEWSDKSIAGFTLHTAAVASGGLLDYSVMVNQ